MFLKSVSPGLVATEMTTLSPDLDPERKKIVEQFPILQPEDIADGVIYALSTPEHVQVNKKKYIKKKFIQNYFSGPRTDNQTNRRTILSTCTTYISTNYTGLLSIKSGIGTRENTFWAIFSTTLDRRFS